LVGLCTRGFFPLTVVGFYSLVDLVMGLASRLRNSLGLSPVIIDLVFPLPSAFIAFLGLLVSITAIASATTATMGIDRHSLTPLPPIPCSLIHPLGRSRTRPLA